MSWQKLTPETKPDHCQIVQVLYKDLNGVWHVLLARFKEDASSLAYSAFELFLNNTEYPHYQPQRRIAAWQPIQLAPLPEFNEHAGY